MNSEQMGRIDDLEERIKVLEDEALTWRRFLVEGLGTLAGFILGLAVLRLIVWAYKTFFIH